MIDPESLVIKYTRLLNRFKLHVIFVWLVILGFSVWLGPQLMTVTLTTFDPPAGTLGAKALAIYQEKFPQQATQVPILVLVASSTQQSVLTNYTQQLTADLVDHLKQWPDPTEYTAVEGFYVYVGTRLDSFKDNFINDATSPTATIIVIASRKEKHSFHFQDYVQKFVENYKKHPDFELGTTGLSLLLRDILQGTAKDMYLMDAIVLPLAMLILAVFLRSFRLLLIPLLSVGISMLCSFTIMLPIAKYAVDVSAYAPSIMSSLSIAMSIDYSLFLLTRYREEVLHGRPSLFAVEQMLRHAGKIVVVSGFTLALTFVGLAFFPIAFLSTVGLGAAVVLVCCVTVNLTFAPAMLLQFESFFAKFDGSWCGRKCSEDDAPALGERRDPLWRSLAKCSTTTHWSIAIVVVVIGCAVPVGIQILHMEISLDTNQVFPRNSKALAAMDRLGDFFNMGRLDPFLIQCTREEGMFNAAGFESARVVMAEVLQRGIASESEIMSMEYASNVHFTYEEVHNWLNTSSPEYNSSVAYLYRSLASQLLSEDHTSTLVQISPPFDPLGPKSENFVRKLREVIQAVKVPSGVSLCINGGGQTAQTMDGVDKIYALFPLIIGVTVGVVFLTVAILFRSLFVPLRLLFTIALPVTWVYGLGVLVFQQGILSWTNLSTLHGVKAFFWLTPVMTFSILVGLGLDYDVFLFSRIHEYRQAGFGTTAAVVKGVEKTGGIITAAGLIMAVAFGGLMMAKETFLVQYGFTLAFAVLVDTFVVRTMLVPAVVHLAGRVNWWPSKMPPEIKTEDDESDDSMSTVGVFGGFNEGYGSRPHTPQRYVPVEQQQGIQDYEGVEHYSPASLGTFSGGPVRHPSGSRTTPVRHSSSGGRAGPARHPSMEDPLASPSPGKGKARRSDKTMKLKPRTFE